MATIADSAGVAFDVVAPVAEVPSSVHSTTPSYADPMIGQYSDNGNDAGQVQLGDLTAAPTIIPDSVTAKILDVESAQVPSIGSMVDVGSDFSGEESDSDSEEDEFVPRGGGTSPSGEKKKPIANPKTNKIPASGSPINAGGSSSPALPANPPQAQPRSGTTAPSASSAVTTKTKTKKP
ncbi:hypothetical protein TRAPUB_4468 [Trametes pubescens]|uniref:Uncharacterized protein n=1 Tax=Trametes pubescens TaxID=154538 RepID=A0A1M2VAT6_TRAPU|nr:hypothetical protein TRAPUB_4468 [Trametes pubescens]